MVNYCLIHLQNFRIRPFPNWPIIPFILVMVGSCALRGQNLDVDDLLNPSPDLSEWTDGGSRSGVFITQTGSLNDASVIQTLNPAAAFSGNTNLVRVLQMGEANLVQISQTGLRNQTDVLQNGPANLVVSSATGSLNVSRFIQIGGENTILQTLVNSNNIRTEFQQIGHDNRIEQTVQGHNDLPFKIIQNGNGLHAIIHQINQ